MKNSKSTPILFISFFIVSLISGTSYGQGNGTIPLGYAAVPATDLMYEGRVLSPSEAFALSQAGEDLSQLDPSEDQDVWKNTAVSNSQIQNAIAPFHEVTFKSFVLSQTGKLRFLAKNQNGETLNYITSKNIHTQLIRRNLLIKLGYQVPEIVYVPRLKIQFSSPIERELFTKELSEKTLGDSKRWLESEDSQSIIINDLIYQKQSPIVDLSVGYIPLSMIRGKRVLNALHAVYSLTDFGESANLFSWATGYIFNNHLHLPYGFESEFFASIDDIKWIANRIAALDRKDWQWIVAQSFLPKEVEVLIVEKLIARRNNLLSLIDLKDDLKYNPKISYGENLIQGELIVEKFKGYPARFSFGDPESPLNLKEKLNYGGVRLLGAVIDNLVSKFNSLPFMSRDLSYELTERFNKNFLEQVFNYMQTGVYKPVPLGLYPLPTYNGNLIMSRDVIAGNYLGTDNLFQLVDTVGVSVFAGLHLEIEGLENVFKNLPASGNGSAGVYYNRLYSHIKPIQSMRAALKYPISNILVPLAQIKIGKKLTAVTSVNEAELTEEAKKELLEKTIPLFNEKMLPGENFIITDTIGASLSGTVGVGLSSLLTAQVGLAGNQFVVSRLNILKVSQTEYQIYRDVGNLRQFQTQAQLNALIPVLKVRFGRDAGRVNMDYYKLTLDKSKLDTENNAVEIEKYAALREAFVQGTIRKLKKFKTPVKFRYKLKQNVTQGSVTALQRTHINSRFDVRVIHPEGQQLDLFRRYTATSQGLNIAEPGSAAFGTIVKLLTKNDFNISGYDGGGNPGFTLWGRARTKTATFEASSQFLDDEYYAPVEKVSRIWNGWVINQKGALKILADIKKRYNHDFFAPDVLNETKKIFLYSVQVNFTFYHQAIRHVLGLSGEEIDRIAAVDSRSSVPFKKAKIQRLKRLIREAQKFTKLKKISNQQNEIFNLIETLFTIDGIQKICGGDQNFFVYARVDGFRSKDENGDQPLFSSSVGEYGHFMVSGPFDYLRRLLGISESELGVNWQLRRLF